MPQVKVYFANTTLRVDSATVYDCLKSGDIIAVRGDGGLNFVSADVFSELRNDGLAKAIDGACGKGWIGTRGFCKRRKAARDKFNAMNDDERKQFNRKIANRALMTAAGITAVVALSRKQNRDKLKSAVGDVYRKTRTAADRTSSRFSKKGKVSVNPFSGPRPGFRTVTEN